jgi:hypothetical protein
MGPVCRHSRLYSSRRCENKGQDTRYWEKYGRRGCANFYMERLCKLHYIPVQGSCLVSNTPAPPHGTLFGNKVIADVMS